MCRGILGGEGVVMSDEREREREERVRGRYVFISHMFTNVETASTHQ
jgi:hypothetical protein